MFVKSSESIDSDGGAAALFIAAGMLLFLGMAALAVDLGLGFNERRIDQTAADSGVMAGALEAVNGETGVRDLTLQYVRSNLSITYNAADWASIWDSCTDPDKGATGYNFVPVPAIAGMINPTIDCLSIDPIGRVRVRLPNQLIDTAFGKILGVNQLAVAAMAEASLRIPNGGNGVMPFGILAGASDGTEVCLRSGSGGTAVPPCDGPASGNFNALDVDLYGNPDLGTSMFCGGSKNERIVYNIRVGVDHVFVAHPTGTEPPPYRIDGCFVPFPNQFNTFTGLGQGLTRGLVNNGVLPLGPATPARLQQGPLSDTRTMRSGPESWVLDNTPLWEYLIPNTGPAECQEDNPIYNTFSVAATAEMEACLANYVTSGSTARLFGSSIAASPRAIIVPQFWESAWPMGGSTPVTLKDFRVVWLQTVMTNCSGGGCAFEFSPGEATAIMCDPGGPGGCKPMGVDQVTGFLLTESMAPIESIFGEGAPGLGPYEPELVR